MTWTITVRGESTTLKPVESLRAVYPSNEFKATAKLEDYRSRFGEVIRGKQLVDAGLRTVNHRMFQRAGWRFVAPKAHVVEAATSRAPVSTAGIAREIFVTDSGNMLVATNLLTVKLRGEVSEEEARQILEQDGVTVVRRLCFGLTLYEVRVAPGAPIPEVIERLQNTGHYEWVEPNLLQSLKPKEQAIPEDIEFELQWHHRNTGVDEDGFPFGKAGEDLGSLQAWAITRGKGTRIAVIDSGMQIDHPDLKQGIVGGGYFLTNEFGESQFFPLAGNTATFPREHHGTFCLGLAGARTNGAGQQDQGGCGIAPDAGLIAIACPSDNLTTQTTLACAIHFAIDPSSFDPTTTPEDGAHVISCSLDTDNPLFSVLVEAISFAAKEGRNKLGVPILWAVENEIGSILRDPVCCLPEVIAVGKYNRDGLWGVNASGEQLALLAPGVEVFSTTTGSDNDFDTGTSYATPLAAGVAALVLAVHPEWTAAQVREKLIASCRPINGTVGHNLEHGFGKLNAFKAVS